MKINVSKTKWKTIRVLRKEAVFHVEINQEFNLEDITGKKNWNDPIFLISIPNYESGFGFVDTRVEIVEIKYPIFKAISITTISFKLNSEIDVFVTEGDNATISHGGGNLANCKNN